MKKLPKVFFHFNQPPSKTEPTKYQFTGIEQKPRVENPNPQAQISGSGPKKFEFKNKPMPNWLFFPTKRRAAEAKSPMADFQPRIARSDLDPKHGVPDHPLSTKMSALLAA